MRREGDVDDPLRHEGPDELHQPVDHQAYERGGDEAHLRSDIAHEPAHDPRVVDLADDVVFLHRRKLKSCSLRSRRWAVGDGRWAAYGCLTPPNAHPPSPAPLDSRGRQSCLVHALRYHRAT